MVSMQDIADKAGVSRVTVSRVLSNHLSVKAETRQKALHWVKELDYKSNLISQSLAGNRTNIIGLLVPEIACPFFSVWKDSAAYISLIFMAASRSPDTF